MVVSQATCNQEKPPCYLGSWGGGGPKLKEKKKFF